ncbi:hypothetical protein FRC11_003401 [Ceratobasidium sp. 423]|nr:hypothetical protein FRC11_003401 [Ceratobasidium sp. 423]
MNLALSVTLQKQGKLDFEPPSPNLETAKHAPLTQIKYSSGWSPVIGAKDLAIVLNPLSPLGVIDKSDGGETVEMLNLNNYGNLDRGPRDNRGRSVQPYRKARG